VARCKGFAELTLLAVSRGRSRRGLGSALLRLVEAWLRSRGVGCAAACAGLDCADFWRKAGYSPETPLLMRWWALLTDPFAHSRVMSKALHDKGG
jgi:GNAT superfamily N-acetyltransferase